MGRVGAWLGLTVLAVASITHLDTLFLDASYMWPIGLAFASSLGLAALLGWLRVSPYLAVPAHLVCYAGFVSLAFYRTQSLGPIPTRDTWSAARTDLLAGIEVARYGVAPLPVTVGVLLLLGAYLWWAGLLAWLGLARADAPVSAGVPLLGIGVYAEVVDQTPFLAGRLAVLLLAFVIYLALTTAAARAALPGPPRARRRLGVGSGLATGAAVLVGAVLLTPLLPERASAGLISWRAGTGEDPTFLLSPFVDIARQLERPDPLLAFTAAVETPVYWRVHALEVFDGRLWSDRSQRVDVAPTALPTTLAQPPAAVTTETIRGTVQLSDNYGDPSLPLPAQAVALQIEGYAGAISVDPDTGTVAIPPDALAPFAYAFEAAIPSGESGSVPAFGDASLTDLPGTLSPSIRQLAEEITAAATDDLERVLALQEFLTSDQFTYDTQATFDETQALEEFLFVEKRGFCVHFASAMAVLSRALGIPARVAVGYLPGVLDAGQRVVTSNESHAWPELYVVGYGWMGFEVTPRNGTGGLASDAFQLPDSGSNLPVPSVTIPEEFRLPVGERTGNPGDFVAPEPPSRWPWVFGALLVPTLAGAVVVTVKRVRRRRRRRQGAAGAWAETLDFARDVGLRLGRDLTAAELGTELEKEGLVGAGALARSYTAETYGGVAQPAAWQAFDAMQERLRDVDPIPTRVRARLSPMSLVKRG